MVRVPTLSDALTVIALSQWRFNPVILSLRIIHNDAPATTFVVAGFNTYKHVSRRFLADVRPECVAKLRAAILAQTPDYPLDAVYSVGGRLTVLANYLAVMSLDIDEIAEIENFKIRA